MGLEDGLSLLTGADPNCLLHRQDEDLAVTDLACSGVLQDRLDDQALVLVLNDALKLELGRTLTVRVEPRYVSTTPFCRPDPFTSLIDRDGNPLSSSSDRIGSNASWRMYA